jgi:N12 class adenine-specific DNA methylase
MSRPTLERIPLSPAEQLAYLDREVAQLRDWIAGARKGGRLTVKRLEGPLLRRRTAQGEALLGERPGITFEATAIDYLAADVTHGYDKLRTPSNVADAAIDGSMWASDLDMKIDYLRRRNRRRVINLGSAAPIANSVSEARVMQRYLRPYLLDDAGISVFDSWAATFRRVVIQVELALEGVAADVKTAMAIGGSNGRVLA